MLTTTILLILIVIAVCLFINFSDYGKMKTQEVKQVKTPEQEIQEEKLKTEDQRFKINWKSDLAKVRQTSLKLTIDEDPNLQMILHGDYSDDAALINKGISLSDRYNSASYSYSFKKSTKDEYLKILEALDTRYTAYLAEVNDYHWSYDVSSYEKFLNEEHMKIKKEIKDLQMQV